MLSSVDVSRLYGNVLIQDMLRFNIPEEAVKLGIECMAHVYRKDVVSFESERSMIADYTDIAHRCAYLHKYAALHTVMVRDLLHEAIVNNFGFFYKLVSSSDNFRICSLGGGPGSDVIGALSALHSSFSYFDSSVTIVDYMADWRFSFESILRELGSGFYGAFGNNTSYYLNWQYVGANLLKTFQPDVNEALSTASLVTMIKFASAAKCQDTEYMIKNIFTTMKPGAILLFIDNDGGGFHELMMNCANEYNFISVFGPLRHENYMNDLVRVKRFGYQSCFKTTVTVHILQKPFEAPPFFNYSIYDRPYFRNEMPRRPSLLGSPLTPMLFRPCDFTRDDNISDQRGFMSPIQEIPQSPGIFMPFHEPTPIPPSPGIFTFHSSTPFAITFPNTPYNDENNTSVYTPIAQLSNKKRKKRQGCFPLQSFRRHLSRKVENVKARARVLFQSKKQKKKAHPICRI